MAVRSALRAGRAVLATNVFLLLVSISVKRLNKPSDLVRQEVSGKHNCFISPGCLFISPFDISWNLLSAR
jgi:hypothetical protein